MEVVKSKILSRGYRGSETSTTLGVTIDEDLMEASNIIEGEKVQIVNINNGERLETYVIKGQRKSKEICLNDLLQERFKGDVIIIISYGTMDFEVANHSVQF